MVEVADPFAIDDNHHLVVDSPQTVDPLGKADRKKTVDRVIRGDTITKKGTCAANTAVQHESP